MRRKEEARRLPKEERAGGVSKWLREKTDFGYRDRKREGVSENRKGIDYTLLGADISRRSTGDRGYETPPRYVVDDSQDLACPSSRRWDPCGICKREEKVCRLRCRFGLDMLEHK